jgi:orotidine-5'-phosphate decarboxylase
MTVSAYQGIGSLDRPRDLALAHGKGLFILAATSNPEASRLQQARTANGKTVAADIAAQVVDSNEREAAHGFGSLGVVLGATVEFADYGIDLTSLARTPILAPGFGAQGAKVDQFRALYGSAASSVIVSVSRSILAAGPEGIVATIESEAAACRA